MTDTKGPWEEVTVIEITETDEGIWACLKVDALAFPEEDHNE